MEEVEVDVGGRRGAERDAIFRDGGVRRVPLWMVGHGVVSGERRAYIGGQGKRE